MSWPAAHRHLICPAHPRAWPKFHTQPLTTLPATMRWPAAHCHLIHTTHPRAWPKFHMQPITKLPGTHELASCSTLPTTYPPLNPVQSQNSTRSPLPYPSPQPITIALPTMVMGRGSSKPTRSPSPWPQTHLQPAHHYTLPGAHALPNLPSLQTLHKLPPPTCWPAAAPPAPHPSWPAAAPPMQRSSQTQQTPLPASKPARHSGLHFLHSKTARHSRLHCCEQNRGEHEGGNE